MMFPKPENKRILNTRRQSAEAINHAMGRFPMIVEILGELDKATLPFPGDEDIRHGCMRALTAILSELSKIEPAPPGRSSKAEELARIWLDGEAVTQLVSADHLQRLQEFIDRILGSAGPPR